ncbi:MAG: flagellar motor protein MotB [Eubacterium sp.]|nr:flagellar motor protein MotB [Eubacterium sp.]
MAKKREKEEMKTDGWMATYSDLVTLLFCFFVLLYAQSSPDKVKIQYIFQAFASGGEYINTIVKDQDPTVKTDGEASPTPGDSAETEPQAGGGQQADFEDLFQAMAAAISESEFSDAIEVSGSPTQIRIKFDNDVLFDSDSFTLKQSGRDALNVIIPGMRTLQSCIASIQVQGHTADLGDLSSISPVNDWDLSSLRASAVIKHMDFQRTVAGEKYLAEGFAQYKPLAENNTPEGRAENRRVEVVVNRDNTAEDSELFGDIMQYDYNQYLLVIDDDGNPLEALGPTQSDVIQQIINTIRENHRTDIEGEGPVAEQVGPVLGEDMINIPDSEYTVIEDESAEEGQESGAADGESVSSG